MKTADSVYELIGNTPLLKLNNYSRENRLYSNIYAKLECFNPAGSTKDRAALYMLKEAKKRGEVNKDTVIIEPTSGNTGIGLAAIAASEGMKAVFVMPENMSRERISLLKAYGAEVVLTPKAAGMKGALDRANELKAYYKNSFIPGQFENPDNPKAHYETTAPEIYNALDGKIDIFVAGIGTGGTLTGCATYLKEKCKDIKIIGVEPEDSPLISKGTAGPHRIQGIGANFVPPILNTDLIDEMITVGTDNAYKSSKKMAADEGILVGISSGAALWAATVIAKKEENKDKNIVVIMPDSGERYMSEGLFE